MDKLMDTPWAIKVVALALALLLFLSVPKGDSDKALDVNVPSNQNSELIEDVPIKAYYDTDNFVVRGVPDTVDITVQGPKNIVQQAKTLKNFEVYVDLTEVEIGTQQIPIKIREISDRLTVIIEPSYANVTIQEKVTKEFKVEAEFNQTLIAEGYVAEEAVVTPNKVKITGAKDVVEKISYVKATLNLKEPINETITREATVTVLDRELNKLDVIIDKETVDVTISVKAASKKVPVNIVREGNAPAGITIESITVEPSEATIIANPDILKDIENVHVEVDISKINDDTEITVPILISKGVVSVSPEQATVKINVTKQEEKTISNIPIRIEGVSEGYNVSFLNPVDGRTNLIIIGSSENIRQLTAADFKVFIDASNLNTGEHNVSIRVNGPNQVTWRLSRETASILIEDNDV